MRARLVSRSFVVGLVACASGLAAAQAPLPNQAPARGRGFVIGQVVDAAAGRPIPGAVVSISSGAVPAEALLLSGEIASLPNAPRQVIADASGRFFFRELTGGSYTIRANAPGYLSGAYGASRPSGLSQPVVLEGDDDRKGGLTVRLWQAALITGRIVDEFGEPAIGMQVRSFRRTFSGGRARLAPGLFATTDDRGVYRFSNLTPGDYLVGLMFTSTSVPVSVVDAYMQASASGSTAAMEQMLNERSSSGAPFPATSGFRVGDHVLVAEGGRGGPSIIAPPDDGPVMSVPTTFYPGATSPAQATVLTLTSGESRTGVDFQLKPRRAVGVSGIVTGPDGPVANIGVRLLIAGAEEFVSSLTTEAAITSTDAAGRFTFLGVTSGTYTLQAMRVPRSQGPRLSNTTSIEVVGAGGVMMGMSSSGPASLASLPLPTDPTLWATMPLTVGEADLQNVSVTMRQGARIAGRLVFEGGEPPPGDQLQRANISISPMILNFPSQVSAAQKRIETDGRFATVGYPAGRYNLSASVPTLARPGSPSTPWRFKLARLGGRDLTDEGLEIGSSDIDNLELVFGTTSTEITGTVTDPKGLPDTGALVVVMPADSNAWKSGVISSRRVRSTRTTTTGAYTLSGLPPGEYFIAAIPEGAFESWQEPRTLDAISRLAVRVSLGEGNKQSQRLTTIATIK